MKFKIVLIIISSIVFTQTNIITPMGATGLGIWATTSKAFKEDEMINSVILDLHLNFGLELSLGKTINSEVDYTFYQFGIAYDVKLFQWGSKFFCKRYDVDDFDFSEAYEQEELGLEIYKRGRKLNSFVRYNEYAYNKKSNYIISNNMNKTQFVTLGGVGRMTRFATYGFGLKMPFDNLFHMRYSFVEVTFGTSF